MSLKEIFSALADGIAAGLSGLWNYPIPFDSIAIGRVIIAAILIVLGLVLAVLLFRMARWTGVILWDLLVIAWLLSRRQLRRLRT